jgi:hypothetical protein
MCIERVHRLMMATLIAISLLLFFAGYEVFTFAILCFMIVMLSVWAIFDFCPALKILSKFIKPCDKECNK